MGVLAGVRTSIHHAVDSFIEFDLNALNWVKGKAYGMVGWKVEKPENLHDLPDNQFRFVDYFAEACPHCVDLTPKWNEASSVWTHDVPETGGNNLKFVKMQCLDDKWQPGSDYAGCKTEGVQGFPTLKMFGPHGKTWEFEGSRTAEGLVTFAKQRMGLEPMPEPEAAEIAKGHNVPAEDSVVEYFGAGCPHCVSLKPTWDALSSSWEEGHANLPVKFVAKECLDADWKPGARFKDCVDEEIKGFPTIRYEGKDGSISDYHGDRTKDDMMQWIEGEAKKHQSADVDGAAGAPVDADKVPESVEIANADVIGRDMGLGGFACGIAAVTAAMDLLNGSEQEQEKKDVSNFL